MKATGLGWRGKYGRPGSSSLLAMIAANYVAAVILMACAVLMSDIMSLLPTAPKETGYLACLHFSAIALAPGAAILYGCQWFWLVVTGRVKGVTWGGAVVYGALIAIADVPVAGLIMGALSGIPLQGLLIGLVILLIHPGTSFSMLVAGSAMGTGNGIAASSWIAKWRASN